MTPPAPAEPAKGRLARVFARLSPWLSLAAGIVGALIMDRSPERAWIAAGAAVLGWVTLVVAGLVLRREPDAVEGRPGVALRVLRFGSFALTQSLVQLTLFFVIPWYANAATWRPGHVVFVAALGLAALLTLWDPLFHRLLARPGFAVSIKALATFAGLNAVLPVLGVSNQTSLWIAAALTALLAPIVAALTSEPGRRLVAGAASLALALALLGAGFLGAVRIVPAAPLRLVNLEIGRELRDKHASRPVETVTGRPAQLVCASAIWAPFGLRDELLHVWTKDGLAYDRIPLEIRGGRKRGFRTWSIKRNFGEDPTGTWRCTVQTSAGQLLGHREVVVLTRD